MTAASDSLMIIQASVVLVKFSFSVTVMQVNFFLINMTTTSDSLMIIQASVVIV